MRVASVPVLALLSAAAFGCISECPTDPPTTVDDGKAASNGYVPSTAFSALLGGHTASLHWLVPDKLTTLHVDITHDPPSVDETPSCNPNVAEFQTLLSVHLYTDDGILDLTSPQFIGFRTGQTADTEFRFYPSFDMLRAGGVTPSGAVPGYDVSLDISTSQLHLLDSVMWWVGTPATKIATITFM
jgi:hypothetical protein